MTRQATLDAISCILACVRCYVAKNPTRNV